MRRRRRRRRRWAEERGVVPIPQSDRGALGVFTGGGWWRTL